MKIKGNSFFKKYKTIKLVLITLLIFSILINISDLVSGYMNGDIVGVYKKNFENRRALYNPERYMEEAVFLVDTVFIQRYSSKESKQPDLIIRGNLLHSKIKQRMRMIFEDDNDNFNPNYAILTDTNYHIIGGKKVTFLKVLKNKINGVAFLKDERYISAAKFNAIASLINPFFTILLINILLILKIKSK